MGKTTKDDILKPTPLPRGHAYMRFRNDGYSVHVDFPAKNIPWLEDVMKYALAQMRDDNGKE